MSSQCPAPFFATDPYEIYMTAAADARRAAPCRLPLSEMKQERIRRALTLQREFRPLLSVPFCLRRLGLFFSRLPAPAILLRGRAARREKKGKKSYTRVACRVTFDTVEPSATRAPSFRGNRGRVKRLQNIGKN